VKTSTSSGRFFYGAEALAAKLIETQVSITLLQVELGHLKVIINVLQVKNTT
jgi:hypothetical protein